MLPSLYNVAVMIRLRAIFLAFSLLFLLLGRAPSVNAQQNAALTAFPTFNGTVRAIAISGTTIYVGGDFTQATNAPSNGGNTLTRNRLAAIDANTGALLSWNPVVDNGGVYALAINGTDIFVGGSFTTVNGGTTRNRLCIFNTSGVLNPWNPDMNSNVVALQWNGARLIVGGFFTTANGGMTRNRICSFTFPGGALDAWDPNATPNPVLTLALSGPNTFVGGAFTNIGGQPRTGSAAIDLSNSMATAFIANTNNDVNSILVNGSDAYLGGTFTIAESIGLNRFCVAASGTVSNMWHPNMNGNVNALAVSGTTVYAGGAFTTVNGGTGRSKLAAFPTHPTAPTATAFDPNITSGDVLALAVSGTTLYAAGGFTTVGGQPRQGFAAFSSAAAPTIVSFTPMNAYPMQVVTINGTNLNQPIGQVQFGGIPSPSVKYISGTQIQAVVPFGAVSGNVSIITGPYTVNQPGFTALPRPQVSTVSGDGMATSIDGIGQAATLQAALGLVRIGNFLYFTEGNGNQIRRIDLTTGEMTTIATGLILPVGLCTDGTDLYFCNQTSHTVHKLTVSTEIVSLLAGTLFMNGTNDGTGTAARFFRPSGICFTGGNLYVADRDNHCIRRVTLGGVVTTLAGDGMMPGAFADGTGAAARFNSPEGICTDGTNLFVGDKDNHRVRKVVIGTGVVTTLAGTGTAGGTNGAALTTAQFNQPSGVAVDPAGNVYVAEWSGHRIRYISAASNYVFTLAGTGVAGFSDNVPSMAQFSTPFSVLYDPTDGNLFVGELGGRRLRKLDVYRYQYVSGDAGVSTNWRIPPANTVSAPDFNNIGSMFSVASGIASATTGFSLGTGVEMVVQNSATLGLTNVTMANNGSLAITPGGKLRITDNGSLTTNPALYVNNTSLLEYMGAAAKTTTDAEFPPTMVGSLILNKTGVVNTLTLNNAKTLSATSILTLTDGRMTTSAANILFVSNPAQTAVAAGGTGYVDGPLRRQFAANLVAPVETYHFPVGAGTTRLPFRILNPTTGVTGPIIELEAFTANAMGVAGTNISLLSMNEYWRMTQVSGNYTSGGVYLERTTPALTAANTIGGNPATANGTYNNIVSSFSTGLTSVGAVTGTGHFLVGTGPATFDWQGVPLASWTVPGNWNPARGTPAPTDVLRFNAGTHTPTNVPSEIISQLIIGGNVTFDAVAPQILTVGTGGVQIASGQSLNLSDNVRLTQNGGGTIQVDGTLNTANSFVNGAGAFTLAAGGTLATTRNDGINGTMLAEGAVQNTGVITYNAGANYSFTSSSGGISTRMSAAGGKPAVTLPIGTLTVGGVNNITMSENITAQTATAINGPGVFLTGANTITQNAAATLNIASGAVLRVQNGGSVLNNNPSGTSFTVQSGGLLEIQVTGQVTGVSSVNYLAGSTLQYSGAGAKTTTAQEMGGTGAQQVIISNTMPVTLGANATIQQSLDIIAASRLVLSNAGNPTLTLNGSLNQNGGANIASVNGANAGSISLGGAGGITLQLDATDNTLNNFTVNRNGAHTITGNLNVRGTLDLTSGILVPSTRILSGDPGGTAPGVITGGNANSYVQGRLQRNFTSGIVAAGTNYAFPIGTAAGNRAATLVNTLTGIAPRVEMECQDAGAATVDMSLTALFSPRNWRVQTLAGVFNGSAITLTETGLTAAYVVARSVLQAGAYAGFGGNSITTTVTSNAGAVPAGANHYFAIGSVQPTVSSVSPTTVSPGDTVTINGSSLGGVTSVGFGGVVAASFQIISNTQIRAVVGMGSSGFITLISPAGVANSVQSLTFLNAPEITMFTPTFGTTGSTVQIMGNRLSNPINVSFGGLNALSFVSGGANSITAVVNLGNSGPVTVLTPTGVSASASSFDFVRTPSIVNFFPKWARAGDTVNIFGGNFPRVTGVNFGTSAYKQLFHTVTSGQIRITVPNDASTGLLRAQALDVGTDSLGTFTMVRPPTISQAQPSTFLGFGQTLTITGTEFHPLPIVRIGTQTAATLEWTSLTEIRATFTQATTGFLTVIASGGTVTLPTPMQVVPPPVITSFSPQSPLPGDVVTVTGANFMATLLTVRVNGIFVQNVSRQSDNRFTFVMPQATSGALLVTSIGGSTAATITFQPITVTAAQPATAPAGQDITLTGTRFTGITSVRFGSVTASQFSVISPTQIVVTVPAGATISTISVSGAAGTGTFGGFTILVPTPSITSFSPQMASPGQTVTITGQNFTGTTRVSFGGVTTAQFTVLSPSQIRAVVPANVSSGNVAVTNPSGMGTRAGFVALAPLVNPDAPLASFPTFNGAVRAVIVVGTTIYVGGSFREATNAPANGGNTVPRSGLAAINATTGALLPWTLNIENNNSVYCLVAAGDRIFVGGDFTSVNDNGMSAGRSRVLAFEVATGRLMAWNGNVGVSNGVFLGMAMDGGVLHVVGDFTMVAGQTRNNACAFDGVGGGLMGNYAPNIAAPTLAVGISGAWVIIGGRFDRVNGNPMRANIVGVGKDNGVIAPWNPDIPTGFVHSVRVDGPTIYLGGNFPTVGGQPRNRLCAVDAVSAAPLTWNPDLNGVPLAIALSNGIVYAGGEFSTVNGSTTRNKLAAFAAPPALATATTFNPNMNDNVLALATDGNKVYAGGAFTTVGGQPRQGFAAFDPSASGAGMNPSMNPSTSANAQAPTITSIAPESAAPMQAVTLTGTRFTGATAVEFGGKEAWFRVISPTEIRTVVPFGAMSGDVSVRNATETGSLAGFTVLESPRVSTLAGSGTAGLSNLAGQAADLQTPRFGAKIGDNVYFSTIHAVRRLNVQTGEVSTIAGSLDGGNEDGTGAMAQFNHPFGLLPSNETGGDGSSHLLVADYIGSRIRLLDIATGSVSLFAGTGERDYRDGALDQAAFLSPLGFARDNRGPVIVSDRDAHAVRLLLFNGVFTNTGQPGEAGSTDGSNEGEARLNGPSGMVVDADNYLYVADNGGHMIRKIWMEDGTVTTLAGTGTAGFADGTSGTAQFNSPMGLALRGTTLFVADKDNHRIRAVSTLTGEVVTVAGSGVAGFADGGLQAAQFSSPHSVLWDNSANALLVFDTDNHRIRRVEVGTITFAAPASTRGTVVMTGATVQAPMPMRITDVSPSTLTEDSPLTLTGENISTNASVSLLTTSIATTASVLLPLEILSRTTTAIVVQIPRNVVPPVLLSTDARLIVTAPSVRISVLQRIVVNAQEIPSVSIVFPNTGSTRSVVSILGQHFSPLSAQTRGSVQSVSIGGIPVQSFTVVSPTVIQVTVGSVRSGKVQIQTLTGRLEASNLFTLDTASPPVVVPPPTPVVSRDSLALNRLFAATQGMQWTTTANWTNGAPIGTRFGVVVQSGRVVELRLPNNGVQGTIPQEVLENLDALRVLDLANNRLSGTLPQGLTNAKNLEVLRLAGNLFSGALPKEVKTMTKLREIDLVGNRIADSITAFAGLTNITVLNLRGNSFRGSLAGVLPQMTGLITLDLSGNNITGALPENLSGLTQVQTFNVRGNRLTGGFPTGLVRTTQKALTRTQAASGLDVLDLGENNFTGPIPEEISNLIALRTLLLDNNAFTGSLPASMRSMQRLRRLDLSNNQFSGAVDFSGVSRLDSVSVANNRFSVAMLELFLGTNRRLVYLPQAEFTQPRITSRVVTATSNSAIVSTGLSIMVTVQDSLRLFVPKTEVYSRTQWRKNGIPLTNLRDTMPYASLIIPAFTLADTGVYECVITNDRLPEITQTTAQVQVLGRNPLTAPALVTLVEPRVNEQDVSTIPRFRWTSGQGVERYRLELAADTTFSTVFSAISITNTPELPVNGIITVSQETHRGFFGSAFPLAADRRFVWRVRAENAAGASVWSLGAFTTLPPDAQLTISDVNFGRVTRFDSAVRTIRLQNLGAVAMTIVGMQTDLADFSVENPPQTIAAGAEANVHVRFRARSVGRLSAALTVEFRIGMSANVQRRTMSDRLRAHVSGVRLVPPPFDTVIVGKNRVASAMLINLEDQAITLQEASLAKEQSPYSLRFREKEITIAPRDTVILQMSCFASTVGTVQSNTLRCVTYRVPLAQLRREDLETEQVELISHAREKTPNDVFVQVGVRVLDDNVAPGSTVRMEVYVKSDKPLKSILDAAQPRIRGRMRMSNQVLVLAPGELGLRRLNTTAPSADGLQGYILSPLFWAGRSQTLAQIRCLAVAGSTATTALVPEDIEWGEGSVIVDSLIAGSFTVKVSQAGGKRLIVPLTAGLKLTALSPNPAKDVLEIAYTLGETGFVEITLLNVKGETVQVLKQEVEQGGEHLLQARVDRLPSGTYTVQVRMNGAVESRQVQVVR
ncbi:MAG: IPT/TIG domain-containing protein [Candidatus Kapabacteria bacterium]|jgi:Leucine-rich repeat (LRR) protein/sugar lactone lactonase YvrE|nr:IPT/TIG domain-containing protein [Candidatus Kapabacteria bacterium]